ncbi:hypothetical protein SADUNF_Sadunf02G0092500 [Salix dunnii]|uniref:Uncharacterized protein n=1 Tax=Salix dunnii TaxID=1413687 RepID=A0A835N710_9ROSI|nr:hypothetical protein SADUNF_Sadunf02G0092500 [Salix dunnii]
MSRAKKECLSFTVSFKESFNYIKPIFVGRTKKVTARNEKEAGAELKVEKMQVEAANEAENVKNKTDKSMAGGHSLSQEDSIILFQELRTWHFYVVKPIESMNSMSRNCVVMPNYSS